MPIVLAYLAPIALLLPNGAMMDAFSPLFRESAGRDQHDSTLGAKPGKTARDMLVGEWPRPSGSAHQVRIEQRVTVRITPRSSAPRQSLMVEAPQASQFARFEERKIGKCVAIDNIAGVQTGSGDRLVLFLRDQRMVSARLEKACRARDFYSGFYVERNKDGKLCVDRDKLQSRTGANCELDRLRELVPVSE